MQWDVHSPVTNLVLLFENDSVDLSPESKVSVKPVAFDRRDCLGLDKKVELNLQGDSPCGEPIDQVIPLLSK